MGFFFTLFFFLVAGGLLVLGWHSIDGVCGCLPMAQGQASGVMGIFAVLGAVVGAVLTALWN